MVVSWIEYALFRLIGALLARMPAELRWKCAGAVAHMAMLLKLKRITIAEENIRLSFPGMEEQHIRKIAFESSRSLIEAFFELPFLARATPMQMARTIKAANPEMARRIIEKYGRAIFISAHYGNWELGALAIPLYFGTSVTIVGKPQRNPYINAYLDRMRERLHNSIIPMDGGVRAMMQALERKSSVALLLDQSATRQDMFVDFFGRPAPTYKAAAALSLKFNIPLLFGLTVRQPDLTYVLELQEIQRDDLQGYSEENVRILTERHVKALEDAIRKLPDQWLWMHRRWKHSEYALS
ncbi:MAG TPA: lysophospholipid acyltransferase family protein [Candidatus Kapabacteria bacterium]|nr:lysophospholipid acyltransferase family protein [Candidatus Kapabacteria bacterium]